MTLEFTIANLLTIAGHKNPYLGQLLGELQARAILPPKATPMDAYLNAPTAFAALNTTAVNLLHAAILTRLAWLPRSSTRPPRAVSPSEEPIPWDVRMLLHDGHNGGLGGRYWQFLERELRSAVRGAFVDEISRIRDLTPLAEMDGHMTFGQICGALMVADLGDAEGAILTSLGDLAQKKGCACAMVQIAMARTRPGSYWTSDWTRAATILEESKMSDWARTYAIYIVSGAAAKAATVYGMWMGAVLERLEWASHRLESPLLRDASLRHVRNLREKMLVPPSAQC